MLVTMTDRELYRLGIIQRVFDRALLGAVLRLAQQKQNELEAEGKRMRSKKMPRRRAQERVLEELRAINPVLASPQDFSPSLKR